MTDTDFDAYKKDRFAKNLKFFDDRAKSNQRGYRITTIYILIVSAAVAPLISFDEQLCGWGIILVKILSPIAAIAAGLTAHYQFHENWLRYRSTWDALQHELAYHDARILDYADHPSPHQLFVERVEALITDEGASWRRTHARKDAPIKAA
jgi:hypothetical protein